VEADEFRCESCRKVFKKDPRLKWTEQRFCGAPACQLFRKALCQSERLDNDQAYRDGQAQADKAWHKYKAPNYHREYHEDLKKPLHERKQRRPIRRRCGRPRRRSVRLLMEKREIRVTVSVRPTLRRANGA